MTEPRRSSRPRKPKVDVDYIYDDRESIGSASDDELDAIIPDFRCGNDDDYDDDDDDSQTECDDDEDVDSSLVRVLDMPEEVTAKNGFKWSGREPNRQSRIPARNIVRETPGNKAEAKNLTKDLDIWNLFFPEEIIEIIKTYTNQKISEEVAKAKSKGRKDVSYKNQTTNAEIRALIGLFYIAGSTHQNRTDSRDMFSGNFGSLVFKATMSEQRFVFLTACLRFDNKQRREELRKTDRLTAMREVWDHLVNTSKRLYTPTDVVTVDEQLLGFHGRCQFKMYIGNKPDKFGLKIIMLCDANTWYMCDAFVYTGKEENISREPLAQQYLLKLTQFIHGTNRTVVCDNWFTSIPAAQKLLENNITLVGTLRANKPEIPEVMLNPKDRAKNTSMFLFHNELTLLSWCPNKKQKKVVNLLSTTHDLPDRDNSVSIPEIVEFYNQNKGGVDVHDRLCKNYTTARSTKRWTLALFFGMLNIAGVNSFILWKNNQPAEKATLRKRMAKEAASLPVASMSAA